MKMIVCGPQELFSKNRLLWNCNIIHLTFHEVMLNLVRLLLYIICFGEFSMSENSLVPVLSTNNISSYVSHALSVKDLTADEERLLFTRYREENHMQSAREIILTNLKLVVKLAYKFRKFRDAADLIQEGNLGLLTAFRKFSLEKGVRFATYATWWIKAKIQEFIISQMSIVRFGLLPRVHVKHRMKYCL